MPIDSAGRWSSWVVLLVGLGCGSTVTPVSAPVGELEPLNAVVTRSRRDPGARLPGVSVTGDSGRVQVEVTRVDLCATLVLAGAMRSPGAFDVVSVFNDHPDAKCEPRYDGDSAVKYKFEVPSVALGLYDVRVFEAQGNVEPRLIAESRTWVSASSK